MDHSLFNMPSDAITYSDIQSFIDQQLEESSVIEYTEIRDDRHIDGVLDIIAAMANTDGGIIFCGVGKDPAEPTKPGKIAGVDPSYVDRIRNKCRSLFQPAFVPEIIPISIPSTPLAIILIRINISLVPQPVLLREKGVLVRLADSNKHADLYRLRQFFASTDPITSLLSYRTSYEPSSTFTVSADRDVMFRFALAGAGEVPLDFTSEQKKGVLATIRGSSVDQWIHSNSYATSWDWGNNISSRRVEASCRIIGRSTDATKYIPNLSIGARLMADLPYQRGYGVILLDVWLKALPKTDDLPQWYPLSLGYCFDLIMSGLETVTNPMLTEHFPTGFIVWSPYLSIHISASNNPWLRLDDISCHGSLRSGDSFQYSVDWSQGDRLPSLVRINKQLLTKSLSDSGCIDHEARIQSLQWGGMAK